MPVGKEGVHCVLPLPLLVVLPLVVQPLWGAFLAGFGTAGFSSVPLLNVTTALTSSIFALGSLAEPISCIPLGFCCVWEGNFPLSRPYCWLDNLEMELCNFPYLLEISECILSIFLLSELSTVYIF